MPLRFRRQHPFGSYILDFYCAKAKLVIEIDGESHSLPDVIRADAIRTDYLHKYGLKILRFTNQEVSENLEGINRVILEYLENKLE